MNFFYVDNDYVDYLRKHDEKVLLNKDEKFQRPYLGIVTKINNVKYLIPICSPRGIFSSNKPQYHRILDGDNLISVLKFNNMIPVCDDVIKSIEFDSILNPQYKILLQKEYQYIKRISSLVEVKAKKYVETLWKSNNFHLSISNNFDILENALKSFTRV
jgi:protein AbiQ